MYIFPIKKGDIPLLCWEVVGLLFCSLWSIGPTFKINMGMAPGKNSMCHAPRSDFLVWWKIGGVLSYQKAFQGMLQEQRTILYPVCMWIQKSCRSQWVRRMTGNDNDTWWQLYTNLPCSFDLRNHPLLMVQNSNTTARLWNENSLCFKT